MIYTRRRHGSLPVVPLQGGQYRVTHPDGTHQDYPNARQLLMALHGGRDPGLTFDRYFRQGRFAPPRAPVCDLAKLFEQRSVRATPLGVDLQKRGHEVAKLLQASCGGRIRALGYDFNEVLQEVYKGLLIRNQGRCPWDAKRGTFGHYVTMVCRHVFANYHKREMRRHRWERVGARALHGETIDAATKAISAPCEAPEWEGAQVRECVVDLIDHILDREDAYRQDSGLVQNAALVPRILPMVLQGKRRGEIAAELGYGGPSIGRALAFLRRATQEWVCARRLH
jgi:hypothetical protein